MVHRRVRNEKARSEEVGYVPLRDFEVLGIAKIPSTCKRVKTERAQRSSSN
jgi:hypothetical protein